jgi:hypothetical protein
MDTLRPLRGALSHGERNRHGRYYLHEDGVANQSSPAEQGSRRVRGVLERVIMVAVMAVLSAGGWFGYQAFAGDEETTLDNIIAMLDWDAISGVISSALGGN